MVARRIAVEILVRVDPEFDKIANITDTPAESESAVEMPAAAIMNFTRLALVYSLSSAT